MKKMITTMFLICAAGQALAAHEQKPLTISGEQAKAIYNYLQLPQKSGFGFEGNANWYKEGGNIRCDRHDRFDFPHPGPVVTSYTCEVGVYADGDLDRYLPFGTASTQVDWGNDVAIHATGRLPVTFSGKDARTMFEFLTVGAYVDPSSSAVQTTYVKDGVKLSCSQTADADDLPATGHSAVYKCDFGVYPNGTLTTSTDRRS